MKSFLTDCTKFEDDLKAYADGELSWLRRRAVRRHLTHCASCREEIIAMTQMTEDLRATEPEDALPPSLREKLLESPVTGTLSAGLLSNESRSGTEESAVSETLSRISRPALRVPGPKRRPIPAWAFAALAIVAWFVCYPLFQKARQQTQTASAPAPQFERQIKVFKPYPQAAASAPSPAESQSSEAQTYDHYAPASIPPPPKVKPLPGLSLAAPIAVRAGGVPLGGVLNADPDSLRQVHKEASIGIQVPNPEVTGDTVNDMVKETGGYVAANNLSTGTDGLKSGEMIVKVPEAQFETFLASVARLGKVQSKNVTGEDITEKTSDAHEAQSVQESDLAKAEARLKTLGSHAKWEDQENTRDLRVQLAQTRARLKLLKRMAALGTLTIDLSQTPKAAAVPPVTNGFIGTLKTTTHDALQSLVGSASALLALVIWLLAYAPIWVPLAFLGRYVLKEHKKRETV